MSTDSKSKRTDAYLLRKHGLTPAAYQQLLADQGNACAICERPAPERTRLFVDHDHITGDVRGLLCTKCNAALGYMGDNADGVRKCLAYLESRPAITTRIAQKESRTDAAKDERRARIYQIKDGTR